MPSTDASLELAGSLLAASDSAARSALIAAAVVEALPDCACVLHRFLPENGEAAWTAVGLAGDVSVERFSMAAESRLLAPLLAESPAAVVYPGGQIQREDYAHLHVNRSIASLAYLPLFDEESLLGAVEVVAFSKVLSAADLGELAPIARLAPPALLAAEQLSSGRQDLLDSIHRMTQLYDLEKSLNATLDLDEVARLAPEKALAMLECQAVHLWLFDGAQLRLMSSSGADATVELRMIQEPGEGYVADMAEEGEPLLIADADDERLALRNAALPASDTTPPVTNVLLVPLMQEDAEVGVLEAVNKSGDAPFDDDDQFFLTAIAETVASALKNASLMFAERKLEILETLVRVSSEITSTLRLDRLLQIIVNSPQNVLPFERCAIALDHRGRLQLKAVSGMTSLPLGDVQVDRLNDLLRWLATQDGALHLRRQKGTEQADLPEAVARHFEATGYGALYSLTLADDQGRVGVLLYEATDPDFLDLPHTEMIKVLAGQATVAIRNALLYREVPLIGLLEPLAQQKRALLLTSGRRRLAFGGGLAAAALFLILCPLPMRISGEATVAPQHLVTIAAPVDGNVSAVFAHEGQRVSAGDLLGTMNDWQWRMDLASSEAKYRAAELGMENDLARGSASAGADRAQMEYLRAEVARNRARLESAQLRSPIAGVVVTPALQNAAGEHLDAGAAFAQVLDLSTAIVDIAISQRDAALLLPGQSAAVKLDSYPQRTWRGAVAIVSPEAQAQAGEGDRTFAARVPLANVDAVLRSGMSGHAKVFIGFRPAGYVLLRAPALWLWQTLWNWIGW